MSKIVKCHNCGNSFVAKGFGIKGLALTILTGGLYIVYYIFKNCVTGHKCKICGLKTK